MTRGREQGEREKETYVNLLTYFAQHRWARGGWGKLSQLLLRLTDPSGRMSPAHSGAHTPARSSFNLSMPTSGLNVMEHYIP